MPSSEQKPETFNHGRYAFRKGWCACEECVESYAKYNESRREYARKLRQKRAYEKNLATIPINPLLEWMQASSQWEDLDRFKRRALLNSQDTKISIYEVDKLCKLFNIHPIEVYGWDWISNPDITEGAEVVE